MGKYETLLKLTDGVMTDSVVSPLQRVIWSVAVAAYDAGMQAAKQEAGEPVAAGDEPVGESDNEPAASGGEEIAADKFGVPADYVHEKADAALTCLADLADAIRDPVKNAIGIDGKPVALNDYLLAQIGAAIYELLKLSSYGSDNRFSVVDRVVVTSEGKRGLNLILAKYGRG